MTQSDGANTSSNQWTWTLEEGVSSDSEAMKRSAARTELRLSSGSR